MPKSNAQRHLTLLQGCQDLVAGVAVIRDAIERAFDVACQQPRRPKKSSRRSSGPSTLQQLKASTGVATTADKTTRTLFSVPRGHIDGRWRERP